MNYLSKKHRTLILLILAHTASVHPSQEPIPSIDADEIAGYVNLHPALEECLTILRKHDTTIPTLATIFAMHLKNPENNEVEYNFLNSFNSAICAAQGCITDKIKPIFVSTLVEAIDNKSRNINKNNVYIYVKEHRDGWMSPRIKEWQNDEFSLFEYAIVNNSLPVVQALLTCNINKNGTNLIGYSPLHFAARYNRIAIMRTLLKAQFPCNTQDYAGQTPLFIAATYKHSRALQILLQAGANPDIISYNKETALTESIDENNIHAIRNLIKANADLHIRYQYGYTALHIATLQNKPKIIKLLLQAGADVNAQSDNGYTALHYAIEHAIQYNDPMMVQLFLDAQADLTIQSRQGMTPLFLVQNTDLAPMFTAAVEKKRKAEEDTENTSRKQTRTAL